MDRALSKSQDKQYQSPLRSPWLSRSSTSWMPMCTCDDETRRIITGTNVLFNYTHIIRVLYRIFFSGGGDMLALSWYHCVRKHAHTREVWGHVGGGGGACPTPPPPPRKISVYFSWKKLWAKPPTDSWLTLSSGRDESNFRNVLYCTINSWPYLLHIIMAILGGPWSPPPLLNKFLHTWKQCTLYM
jgi:hypothetical protein